VGALASPLAFAQTTTIYGGIDVGYQNASSYAPGSVNHNFVQSGGDYTSRIGFKGSDDLAPGLTAVYVLEAGIAADNGTQDTAGFWQRQVYGGLDSKQFGALTIGRQYTHMYNQAGQGYWSALTLAGGLNPAGFGGGTQTQMVRASNYVKYSSPKFSGFSAGVGWSPGAGGITNTGNEPTAASAARGTDDGRYWDMQVSWAQGPLAAAFSHNNQKASTSTTTGELKRNQFTAHWDNGAFGIFGGYAKDTADGTITAGGFSATGTADIKRYWLQPLVRFAGNNEVFGMWGRQKFEVAGTDAKSTTIALVGRHYMTKRTWVYAGIGKSNNDDGVAGSPTVFATGVTAGQDPRGVQVGVATTF
jgi:predicted porin